MSCPSKRLLVLGGLVCPTSSSLSRNHSTASASSRGCPTGPQQRSVRSQICCGARVGLLHANKVHLVQVEW